MQRRIVICGGCWIVATALSSLVFAQSSDDGGPPATEVEKARQMRMQQFASSHELVLLESGAKATLHQQPIISWSNPERQAAIGGAGFVWVLEGRPVATIGLWTYKDTKDSYEYQSLCEQPVKATRGGATVWSTSQAGLEFLPLTTKQPPGATVSRRLLQMRTLARTRFSSRLRPDTARSRQLRLLPQPLYRYETMPEGVIDGAMFAFAQGNDPETLLLLEARQADGESQPQWYYAFGSQTSGDLDASLDERVVWDNQDRGDTFMMRVFFDQ